jgi:hypothetical protein
LRAPRRPRRKYVAHFKQPNEFAVALRGNTVERYTPRNNLIQEYDISNYRQVVESLMLLGFGMTGRQLAASFEITGIASESISGQKTTHLEMKPKSADLRKHVNRIELWIADELGCAIQQKFYPDGSFKLVTFSNLTLVPKLGPAAFQLHKGAKRERVH